MTTMTKEYEVGDTIAYLSYNAICVGRVTAKHADVKNGCPGFEIINSTTGNTWWGFDNQIIKVHPKEKK